MSMRYETITYYPHARLRMDRRRVSEKQIARALNRPDARIYESEAKLVCEVPTLTGATLRDGFVETAPKAVLVITVIRIGT